MAELAGNQNVVAAVAVEDGSGLVPHEILLSRLGGPWQQEGGYLRLRLLWLALLARLARLPLQVQENGLARRLRLHGRSVRGGFAAIQPLHQAMLQVRRQVVFTCGLLAGLDEFFKDGQSLLAADAVKLTRSECERKAREAAANLVLSTALPHSVRMGTCVLETLDDMRDILSYPSRANNDFVKSQLCLNPIGTTPPAVKTL